MANGFSCHVGCFAALRPTPMADGRAISVLSVIGGRLPNTHLQDPLSKKNRRSLFSS